MMYGFSRRPTTLHGFIAGFEVGERRIGDAEHEIEATAVRAPDPIVVVAGHGGWEGWVSLMSEEI